MGGRFDYGRRSLPGVVVEWIELEKLNRWIRGAFLMQRFNQSSRTGRRLQAGFSLIELMIASLVMVVGLTGDLALILTVIANDYRSKADSSATILAQMAMEMVASVPANATSTSTPSSSVTVMDCNPTSSSASH